MRSYSFVLTLLFAEPAGEGDDNCLWQYLVASAQNAFLFFLLFLQPLSYSFQGKSFLQTAMFCCFFCPVYWPDNYPMKNRCYFLTNDSIKKITRKPAEVLMHLGSYSVLLLYAATNLAFLRRPHQNRYFVLIY